MKTFHQHMTQELLEFYGYTQDFYQELVWDTVNRFDLTAKDTNKHTYGTNVLFDEDGNKYENFLGIVAATYDKGGWPHLQFMTGDEFSSEVIWED